MPSILSAPGAWLSSSPTTWYVVFCAADSRHWWDRLLRIEPGFSHVYALRWDGFNWILFNPHTAFTDIAIAAVASQNALDLLVEPGATVVEVQAFRRVNQIRGRWWIGPMTCVEQIKALLGLPVERIWTPRQLFRYLMEHCDGQETENPGTHGPGSRSATPHPRAVERSHPRGKRQAQGHDAGAHGPPVLARRVR